MVNAAVRGTVLATLLVVAMTGCGGGSEESGPAGGQNGDSLEGHEGKAPVALTSDQVRMALPSTGSLPEGWRVAVGGSAEAKAGQEAASDCENDTQSNCGGLVTMGRAMLEAVGASQWDNTVFVKVHSFDSVENAGVAMKSLVAAARKQAGTDAEPMKVSAGAEETDAFSEEISDYYSADVTMRVGTVVVHLSGTDLAKTDGIDALAKFQIDRIKQAASGKNPDA
ncbi:hypothetical protein FE633_12845 [Streptomyces montanus]|uniref:DUF3558 domain-containing protein n=1 Tax=Streptomyces montanus TaxID=2580423 RepID=A0A5R9FSN7_9ACTN|nr:hypothetical protein [Streptomyces montanus]TLS45659.1 hypothetical protein FE633_12845 [Streptomyces montanus]